MEPRAKCRRVLFADSKNSTLPSSFEEEENELASVLRTMKGIVTNQQLGVIRFSEDLLFDTVFTSQREALVQWMTEVCSLLAALPATLHLSVALLDARFFHDHPPKSKYQLIAASAMLVAGLSSLSFGFGLGLSPTHNPALDSVSCCFSQILREHQ